VRPYVFAWTFARIDHTFTFMSRVLVTRPVLSEGIALLRSSGLEPTVLDGVPADALAATIRPFDAVIAMLSDRFSAEVFASLKGGKVRIIANYAVGFDNIDLLAAKSAGIEVTNTPEVLTEATAEMAWALLFAAARRIGEGERLTRTKTWKGWEPTQLVGFGVSGKRLGIIGAGRIGQAFGRMAKGFNMRLSYWNRSRRPLFESETGATYQELDELLSTSDFVSIHLPGGGETRHLIDATRIALLKPSAVLVNTGRGSVIDEAALAKALKEKRIAAAGLDVYEREPVIEEALFDLDNVILAPHLGSATFESRLAMVRRCAENIIAALKGERPPDALVAD
jgi:glyoxylate reductase